MTDFLAYLSQEHAWYTFALPWAFVAYWLATERTDARVLYHWVPCTLWTNVLSWWVLTPDTIQLHMVDVFFFYLAFYLYLGYRITPLAAYSLTYLSVWVPDMMRSRELVGAGYASAETYYFGVGGAGLGDGLVVVPLAAAALVHYVAWRRK